MPAKNSIKKDMTKAWGSTSITLTKEIQDHYALGIQRSHKNSQYWIEYYPDLIIFLSQNIINHITNHIFAKKMTKMEIDANTEDY